MNIISLLSANPAVEAAAEVITETQAIENASQNMSSMMNNGMTIGEKTIHSLEMTGIGMGTVFAVLIILWGALELFQYIFYTLPSKNKKTAETVVEESAPVVIEETPVNRADDNAIIAVISAAVAAYENKPASGFRVVSFKRVSQKNGWNKYGE